MYTSLFKSEWEKMRESENKKGDTTEQQKINIINTAIIYLVFFYYQQLYSSIQGAENTIIHSPDLNKDETA